MKVINRNIQVSATPSVIGDEKGLFSLTLEQENENLSLYKLKYDSSKGKIEGPIMIQWRIPAINIKGVWAPNSLHEKRIHADWEFPQLQASISRNAPVLSIFGHSDENILTFSCTDIINAVEMEAALREEDNQVYCTFHFFTEQPFPDQDYETIIRIDSRPIQFSKAVQSIVGWWQSSTSITPTHIPEYAKVPLYSTWYSYHQDLDEESLLYECRESYKLGCKLIIIDDGWQTLDTNRGYDYTGDWEPDRFPNMADFVEKVHAEGMKMMIWYSVPFCGKKSKAYQIFKGKFLTENHHWAPVFDPRFPEVRSYLVNKYVQALLDWNIDGFKLDFIDDFKVYPETELKELNGRDTLSVFEGVNKLIQEARAALHAINKDVLIEFRQKYIGPALHQLGNMFRAFDCPNDSLTNRIRTTDVKLLSGSTPVHSDMFTWHKDESVEKAALQITSILFSVPQLSVRLKEVSDQHKAMVKFWFNYWATNKDVLLDGEFTADSPSANYPLLKAQKGDKIIAGIYDNMLQSVKSRFKYLDVINGKLSPNIVLNFTQTIPSAHWKIVDCMGNIIEENSGKTLEGITSFQVPANGILQLENLNNTNG